MGFRRKLQYLLVKKCNISNAKAIEHILEGEVFVNQQVIKTNIIVSIDDEIRLNDAIVQAKADMRYYKFYKPRGIETTLNSDIEDNILKFLPSTDVFPIGRLDKDSEGLLILSNDGRIYDKILRKENQIKKEYEVIVHKIINEVFIETMSTGIVIMGKKTEPCVIRQIDDFSFTIILKQGLNRQIRRMCYKMGYEVVQLKRMRIGGLHLGTLTPGSIKVFELKDLF